MLDDIHQAFDPKEFLAKVGEGKTIVEFRKDQVVFAQGDAANTVFYIQKGRVKVVVISDQGKEAVVGILGSGQFFGEGCMNGHSLRSATATALEGCRVTAITKAAKNGWRGCYFCWRILARREALNRSVPISARKHWLK